MTSTQVLSKADEVLADQLKEQVAYEAALTRQSELPNRLCNDPRGHLYFYYPEGKDVIYLKHHVDSKTTINRIAKPDDMIRFADAWEQFKPGKGKKKSL